MEFLQSDWVVKFEWTLVASEGGALAGA
jgi:hypothetical protein